VEFFLGVDEVRHYFKGFGNYFGVPPVSIILFFEELVLIEL